MKCKKCDYRLWRLTTPICPECGEPFRPSEFEFVANSVQFRCPHCDQDYYGTNKRNGHLDPPEFSCISCRRRIHMDEMVLFPTEEVTEEQTRVDHNPWLERKEKGAVKSWFIAIGRSMFSPGRLMKSTPLASSTGSAMWFAIFSLIVFGLLSSVTFAVLIMLMGIAGGPPGGPGAPGVFGIGGIFMMLGAFGIGSLIVYLLLWGLTTHAILRISGDTAGGLGRTFQALSYSAGPNVLTAIPCVGYYFSFISIPWWAVSAILMLIVAQKVSGLRASFSVLALPALGFAGVVAFSIWAVASFSTAMGTMQAGNFANAMGEPSTKALSTAILSSAQQNAGAGPAHMAELLLTGELDPSHFTDPMAGSNWDNVPLSRGLTLGNFYLASEDQLKIGIKGVVDSMPPNVVAHRLGDFVFTYHGIDLRTVGMDLWIVVMPPTVKRRVGTAGFTRANIVVGTSDGNVLHIEPESFEKELAEQNALREEHNLPPLPNPLKVTHEKPATAD